MNNSFFNKCLQSTIYRYPVKLFTCFSFNITMSQGSLYIQKKIQNFFATFCYA